MATKAQTNGMRGVYLVASELARLGLVTSPTSRSARGADILATTANCKRAFSIEVKTTTNNTFWMLPEHAKSIGSPSHVYVFVHIQTPKKIQESITYYPVTSKFIRMNVRRPDPESTKQYRKGYSIDLLTIRKFENKWTLFEEANE